MPLPERVSPPPTSPEHPLFCLLVLLLISWYSEVSFQNLFSKKHDRTFPDKLTLGELWNMSEGKREALIRLLWLACMVPSQMEYWAVLYVLAGDQDDFLSKQTIRCCYDDSSITVRRCKGETRGR
ncbi:hypothetical protein Pfo_014885 [Paulownia fortunei]|nr:hypothetical protein Pfo_014885 [Paulownia fortunei]